MVTTSIKKLTLSAGAAALLVSSVLLISSMRATAGVTPAEWAAIQAKVEQAQTNLDNAKTEYNNALNNADTNGDGKISPDEQAAVDAKGAAVDKAKAELNKAKDEEAKARREIIEETGKKVEQAKVPPTITPPYDILQNPRELEAIGALLVAAGLKADSAAVEALNGCKKIAAALAAGITGKKGAAVIQALKNAEIECLKKLKNEISKVSAGNASAANAVVKVNNKIANLTKWKYDPSAVYRVSALPPLPTSKETKTSDQPGPFFSVNGAIGYVTDAQKKLKDNADGNDNGQKGGKGLAVALQNALDYLNAAEIEKAKAELNKALTTAKGMSGPRSGISVGLRAVIVTIVEDIKAALDALKGSKPAPMVSFSFGKVGTDKKYLTKITLLGISPKDLPVKATVAKTTFTIPASARRMKDGSYVVNLKLSQKTKEQWTAESVDVKITPLNAKSTGNGGWTVQLSGGKQVQQAGAAGAADARTTQSNGQTPQQEGTSPTGQPPTFDGAAGNSQPATEGFLTPSRAYSCSSYAAAHPGARSYCESPGVLQCAWQDTSTGATMLASLGQCPPYTRATCRTDRITLSCDYPPSTNQ
ncbi:MAG: hypothetical protein HYV25_03020 [Candidatus Harrisonbacteria bacterium]|nr:hypothetical protein [Candidatus Harrisonbacteria bacterium]